MVILTSVFKREPPPLFTRNYLMDNFIENCCIPILSKLEWVRLGLVNHT